MGMDGVIKIRGNENIINSGYIAGDLVACNEYTIVNINFMDNEKVYEKLSETVDALNNLSKTQVILSDAILKQRENDNQQNEALTALARAAENNSLANLRLSESLMKDKELMERLINILEQAKNDK